MSFTPKTWHDYPPNTDTPITKDELNRIEQGIADSYTAIDTAIENYSKNYVVDSFLSVNPGWTRSTLQKTVTLDTTSITCTVAKTDFDPEVDGVMIWQENYLVVSNLYDFDTTTDPDNVIISFSENMRTLFETSASIEIVIYEKPPDSGGETAVVNGYLPAQRAFTTPVRFSGAGLTSYEICVCFRATVMPTASRPNTFFGASGYFFNAPSCEINNQGIWHGFAYSGNGWGYDVLTSWNNCPIALDGTMQWIKVTWDSTSCKQTLLHSTDGLTYTEISSFSTPSTAYTPSGDGDYIVLGGVANNGSHSFQEGNDINIFNSYIKMNGTLVFGREVTA